MTAARPPPPTASASRARASPFRRQSIPKAVFNRLFAEVGADPDLLALERAKSKSILDSVIAEYDALTPRVGQADRAKLDEHLSRIREIEIALTAGANETTGACVKPAVPTPLGDPNAGREGDPGDPGQKNPSLDARMPEVGKAMMDMLVMALAESHRARHHAVDGLAGVQHVSVLGAL